MSIFVHIAIYCVVISVYLFFTVALNPRYWLHRMPKAITEKVPPRTKKETRGITLLGLPFLVFMVAYPVWYAITRTEGFFAPVLVLLAFFAGFTVWDTIVLDILLFCTITPRFIVIEGTTRADYKDKLYHVRAGLKGLIISACASVIIGGMIFAVKLLIALF